MGTPDQCAIPVLGHTASVGLGLAGVGGTGVRSPERAVLIIEEERRKAENKRGRQ